MVRRDLVRKVAEALRDGNVRKPTKGEKFVFKISDECGGESSFTVNKPARNVGYTIKDVDNIINVTLQVIFDAVKKGEPISVRGFGTLRPHLRKARNSVCPETFEPIFLDERYTIKFFPGEVLKKCGRIYDLAVKDGVLPPFDPKKGYDEYDGADCEIEIDESEDD